MNTDLWIDAREGGHHSGNWDGLLSNPAIQLTHALSTLVGPTGQIRVPGLVPREPISANVRAALADCALETGLGSPAIDPNWGEPGLTGPEKVYGWCSFEILAMEAGNPRAGERHPAPRLGALPTPICGRGGARGHPARDPAPPGPPGLLLRPGRPRTGRALPADAAGPRRPMGRLGDVVHTGSTGKKPAQLPNFGGPIPNDAISEILGLPTLWVPHSYPGCSQHASNEHLPGAPLREAPAAMTGLYWDLGEALPPREAGVMQRQRSSRGT